MRIHSRAALLAAFTMCGACSPGPNYLNPVAPRYAAPSPVTPSDVPAALRIVTFNIKYAREVDSAIAVLTSDPVVMNADVLLLQEMDAPGSARIADALGMGYVYYPASLRGETDFGNAVLSRWAIEEDTKIILPHLGRLARTARTATGATLRIGTERVRVYSIHLATFVEISERSRRDQIDAVLNDAAQYDRVIIGGDLNNHAIGGRVVQRGYAWPTKEGPRTVTLGRWDHVFLRGLKLADSTATGTVLQQRGASDHRPVWAVAVLDDR